MKLGDIINLVLEVHDDFTYEEVKEICEDFLSIIPSKIKEETKIKRLNKYINKEFELENIININESNKIYNLETIPKYLFNSKKQTSSNLINIINLTKNIERSELFLNANFKVNSNEKIALIWKNWTWKTTLLKMILRKEEITDWIIEVSNNLKIWYLSQDLFWKNTNNTLQEEMLEVYPEINKNILRLNEIKSNKSKWKEIEKINKYLIEVDWFKKHNLQLEILKYFWFTDNQMNFNVLQLSGWEQTKVQIAKFLIQEVDLLILDEPTNHLDIKWIIFLEQFCNNWKKSILSISHDIRFINNTSNKIAEIYNKQIMIFNWNYNYYLEEKKAIFEKQNKDYLNQKKQLDIQNEYINKFKANSAKASSVQSRIKAINKIKILEKPINEKNVWDIELKLEKRLPEIIIKLNNILVWYKDVLVTLPSYLEVNKRDKIWIIWWNWTGKTTLLKTILWELKSLNWIIEINKDLIIGSYSQVLENLNIEENIINELGRDYENEKEIRTILWWLLINWDKVYQKISTLSWWEKAKVALTKMLLTKPHIIIMDEPTNHLDLHSKEVIKKMLNWFSWTTLIVSHDRDLLENISNKIWLVKNKKLEIYNEIEIWFKNSFE